MRAPLALLLVAACGSSAPPPAPLSNTGKELVPRHEPLATIERTPCYGRCPIYKVTIFRDGVVEYEGKRFVKTRGQATGHISPEQLTALDQLFQQHGYLALKDSYEEYDMTDMPSVYTSYSPAPGQTKSIKHYHGDQSAPEELVEVEAGIDRIIHIEQWIGTRDERHGGHED
jgi:Domain of unknown function (DUF6438)